jgi:iron complex outermembrane recepter protein
MGFVFHLNSQRLAMRILSSKYHIIRRSHRSEIFHPSIFLTITLVSLSSYSMAQKQDGGTSAVVLKKLSIEELMNVEVVSVSKRPEKLAEVSSAIQVITQEDIRRSSATSIPEALRLAPNLQVAQYNAYTWSISSRGFNTTFSNKLLVMIDGRTVYTPLFGGVYWDAQHILMDDIERIEIISGPGGTLWGVNAVNGVINIITKKAKDTQGLYVSAAAGSFWQGYAGVRYGGTIGPKISYRVFAQYNDRNNTFLPEGRDTTDGWKVAHSGFHIDWNPSEKNSVAFQGNLYNGTEYTSPKKSTFDGQNIITKWSHTFSNTSSFSLQLYFDRTWRRNILGSVNNELDTYDFEFQHRFVLTASHTILWGVGYRFMKDETINTTPFVGLIPQEKDMNLFSGFIQDEIMLVPDKLKLTLGTKLQHTVYSDFELQPSARIAFTPTERHTVWGAISRAVRSPSRADVDYFIPTFSLPPESVSVTGGPNFVSEKVIAYELGYRVRPTSTLSLSLATFYNDYDDVYSVEPLPNTLTYQIQNGSEGESWGIELSGVYQLLPNWRLRGGYTFFDKDLRSKPGHNYDPSFLGNDPQNQVLLQSMIDLPANFQLDIIGRYIDRLAKTATTERVPAYSIFDMRLAWNYNHVEISLVGQNLWEKRHVETGTQQIPRGIYGKITVRL